MSILCIEILIAYLIGSLLAMFGFSICFKCEHLKQLYPLEISFY